MTTPQREITLLLQNANRFVLTTHVNPDGDGLGSELALARWLRARGKQVHIINVSPTPAVYRFLDSEGLIETYAPASHNTVVAASDAIVVLDTNHPERLRALSGPVLAGTAVRVCIDHHLDPAPFADHYLLDDNATATGEIVYDLLAGLEGFVLTPGIAEALYCAIMTDTGSFRYPRVGAATHLRVARLIEHGADPVRIYHEVHEQWTGGRLQLLGSAIAGLRTTHDGRLAYITVTRSMFTATGTSEEDTDNFTVYPMSVSGVRAGILFVEEQDGVKVSLRSRGEIPINELAREFGGNGHRNAAGARMQGVSLDAAVRAVVAAAERYLIPRSS